MRTVEASRFVAAGPDRVSRLLTPESIVAYEGTFEVTEVTPRGAEGDWLVAVGARGLDATLRFEPLEDGDGFYYEQLGEEGPLAAMETTLVWRPENEGTRVTATSSVSLGVRPASLADRIAAWKRKGELRRALEALAADAE
ncbi:SRPBCC family protein [Halovivax sp.]|uniref:SRPBCC family protein n=1 Tax=Halovivax sp. TaxID=1935978 RepID=UPI0025C5A594|nr:SRPBCC family protein [Halovivax sp.]